jgi:hypothetical protein
MGEDVDFLLYGLSRQDQVWGDSNDDPSGLGMAQVLANDTCPGGPSATDDMPCLFLEAASVGTQIDG